MELTQTKKERLVELTNKAIDAFHKQFKNNSRDFMYHYAIDDQGIIYCVHHMPKEYGIDPNIVDISILSKDLAILSYFLQDIINQKYFR